MRFIALVACALIPCAIAPAAAANLILDGGFEATPARQGAYGHHAAGSSFDGGHWFVTGVDVLHVDTAYSVGNAPPLTFNAHGGRNSLDLTGTGNSSPQDGIYQDIATVAGQAYTLSFFVGRALSTGSVGADYRANATVRVSIDGGPVSEFVNGETIASGIVWKSFDLGFTATDATTRIAFFNGSGNDYLGLDDVAVDAVGTVPEPTSWALFLTGFAAIGAGLRTRQRVTA
jgi:hypothetical protein